MKLTNEDRSLFFRLWFPLLRYCSATYDLHVDDLMTSSGGFVLTAAKDVADAIWSDVSIIDRYISQQPDINDEERAIVTGWKRVIPGRFVIERHLRGGSIFISLDSDNRVYLVKGLTDSFQEMFEGQPKPILVSTSLLPFKGSIITDGLFKRSRMIIGPNYARGFKEIYMAAKREGRIEKTI